MVANPALGGTGVWNYVTNAADPYNFLGQLASQSWGVVITIIWSGAVSFIAYKLVDILVGLRVTEEDERLGLDTTEHGETAYNL